MGKAWDEDKGGRKPWIKWMSEIMTECLRVLKPEGVVLDPFMGSGSTGVSAIKEGFTFIGIEKEEEYFKISEKRLA